MNWNYPNQYIPTPSWSPYHQNSQFDHQGIDPSFTGNDEKRNWITQGEFSGKILVFLDANVRSVFVSFQKYWITQFLMFQQILVWSPILITNLSEMVLVHTNRARFHLILSCRAHTKPITLLIIMWPQPVWVSVHWMGHSRTRKSRTIQKWRFIHGWDECMRRKIKEVHINLVPYHL